MNTSRGADLTGFIFSTRGRPSGSFPEAHVRASRDIREAGIFFIVFQDDGCRALACNFQKAWRREALVPYFDGVTQSRAVSFTWQQIEKALDVVRIECMLGIARDLRVRGTGMGAALMGDAITRIVAASAEKGIYAIVVDAKTPELAKYVQDYGFIPFPSQPPRLWKTAAGLQFHCA